MKIYRPFHYTRLHSTYTISEAGTLWIVSPSTLYVQCSVRICVFVAIRS